MPKKSSKDLERERTRKIEEGKIAARDKARESLNKYQFISGIFLILSAIFGIYLLATDQSLWILAVSHAYGLVAIVGIDLLFGTLCVFMVGRVFLWSVAGGLLGVLLQIGDILTAPQYGMTVQYFAGYLFGLWAFDALLATQLIVVFFAILSRVHIRTLTEQGEVPNLLQRIKTTVSKRHDCLRRDSWHYGRIQPHWPVEGRASHLYYF